MSRGGRGRGGTNKSFSREQLSSLGVGIGNNEVLPGPVTQPPPLFPLLDHKPIGLNVTPDLKYQLMLKQEFVDTIRGSAAFIQLHKATTVSSGDYQLDKLLAQMPCVKNTFNWALFPTELRPKFAKKKKSNSSAPTKSSAKVKTKPTPKIIKSEKDIVEHLNTLEKLEKKAPLTISVKQEREEPEEDEDILMEDEEDEEMDDGTDYANNYFDNGEAYEDEDDALEDGPCY